MAATNSTRSMRKPAQKTHTGAQEKKSGLRYAELKNGEKMKIEHEDGKYYYFASTKLRKMNQMIARIVEDSERR